MTDLKIALLGDFSPKEIKTIKSHLNCEIAPNLYTADIATTHVISHASGNSRYYAWNRTFWSGSDENNWTIWEDSLEEILERITSQIKDQSPQCAPPDDATPAPSP